MSRRNWQLFIEDILESIKYIQEYIAVCSFDDFKKDRKTIDAVVRNFEIIGEASKYVPDSIKGTYKDVDWQAIIGLRNRITHEYFGISLAIIWHIIKKELPKLKQQMKEILKQYKQ
jgi:uncharacterized protein with HEPN domain